jgi:hypothetical protein
MRVIRVIRKQVYELTVTDLVQFPTWEFALDEEGTEGQDEATVRPYPFEEALDPKAGTFVIRATFKLNDGTDMKGYMTTRGPPLTMRRPRDDSLNLGRVQPVIISSGGQVIFWRGIFKPTNEEIEANYRRLGKSSSAEVFPLRFSSDVPLLGGPVQGELPGFLFLVARTVHVIS